MQNKLLVTLLLSVCLWLYPPTVGESYNTSKDTHHPKDSIIYKDNIDSLLIKLKEQQDSLKKNMSIIVKQQDTIRAISNE